MGISQNPSFHLSKKSQPDSDWRLEEPSQMKSDAIDCWLNHWLQLQKKGKQPLVLKDGSGRLSEHLPVMTPNGKASRSLSMLTVRCRTMWKCWSVMFPTPMGMDPVPPTIMILHKGRSLGPPFILHHLGVQHWANRPNTHTSNHCLTIKTISNCCYFSE